MKWHDSICLSSPLLEVRRLAEVPFQDWWDFLNEREQAARELGRLEGERALSQQIEMQRAEMAQLQQGVLDSLRGAVPHVVQEAESALLRLALESAQKVVAGLPIDAQLVEAVVREALDHIEDKTEVLVQLHPEDLSLLQKNNSLLLNHQSGSGPIRFVASGEVARGGCVVQTRFGLIDASRNVKFEQLQETLTP